MRNLLSYILLLASLIATGCKHEETGPTQQQLDSMARADSMALHIALVANEDCLPIYYAHRTGLADSLGLDLRIESYMSLMDCDTAAATPRILVAYQDVARAALANPKADEMMLIASLPNKHTLAVNRKKRISQIGQLKQCVVAIDRHSTSEYWCDALCDTARIGKAEIYRPQINDLELRLRMMMAGQYEFALLPQPYARIALGRKHRSLWQDNGKGMYGALSMKLSLMSQPERLEQIKLLRQVYDEASRQLNAQPDTAMLRTILETDYHIDPKYVPLALPVSTPSLQNIDETTLAKTITWLSARGQKTHKPRIQQ